MAARAQQGSIRDRHRHIRGGNVVVPLALPILVASGKLIHARCSPLVGAETTRTQGFLGRSWVNPGWLLGSSWLASGFVLASKTSKNKAKTRSSKPKEKIRAGFVRYAPEASGRRSAGAALPTVGSTESDRTENENGTQRIGSCSGLSPAQLPFFSCPTHLLLQSCCTAYSAPAKRKQKENTEKRPENKQSRR